MYEPKVSIKKIFFKHIVMSFLIVSATFSIAILYCANIDFQKIFFCASLFQFFEKLN